MKSIAFVLTCIVAVQPIAFGGKPCSETRVYTLTITTSCVDTFTVGKEVIMDAGDPFRDDDGMYALHGFTQVGEQLNAIFTSPYWYWHWNDQQLPMNANVVSATFTFDIEERFDAELIMYIPQLPFDETTGNLWDDLVSELPEAGPFPSDSDGIVTGEFDGVGIYELQEAVSNCQGWYSLAIVQKSDQGGTYANPRGCTVNPDNFTGTLTITYTLPSE